MAFDTFDTDSVATAGITFTNGNLTAQPGAGFSGTACAIAQTVEGKNSGKWYVEFTLVAVSGVAGGEGVGLLASWGLQGNVTNGGFIGGAFGAGTSSTDAGWAHYINNNLDHNATAQSKVNGATYTAGDVIGLAIDLTNNRAWWRKNTGNWIGTTGTPDPATNTSGFDISGLVANGSHVYPAVNMSGSSAKFTANFGASAFTGSVPSGFTSGWTNTTAGTYFGSFATTGKGSSAVQSPPQNNKAVSKYTATITGSVPSIIVPFAGTATIDLKGLIYDSGGVGGLPGALLGISTNTLGAGSGGEKTFLFSGVSVVNGTGYWFGFVSDQISPTNNVTLCPPQTLGIAFNSGTYASPTNPFGLAPSTANFRYPVIINVTQDQTVNLSGVNATSAAGDISVTVAPLLVGVSATAAAGSFSLATSPTIALSSVQAAAAAGTLGSIVSAAPLLSGAQAIAACGTLIPSATSTISLTGVEATALANAIRAATFFITVPMITILDDNPIPAYGLMDSDPVPNEASMPYQVALDTVLNRNPIPMRGTLTAVPIPGEGSVP